MNTKSKAKSAGLTPWLGAALLTLAATSAHSQSPWAATQAAGPVAQTGATLNGMATARG
jgi:hypothetical protein